MSEKSGPPYGDTHEERARELAETGVSVRRTGRPVMAVLAEWFEQDERSEEKQP